MGRPGATRAAGLGGATTAVVTAKRAPPPTTATSTTSALGRRIVHVDPCGDSRWETFVANHQDSLIYHHPRWLEALADGYGHQPSGLACEAAGGEFEGVLPLFRTRGVLTGRRLVCLPHTPVAGPLGSDRDATAALLAAAVERARSSATLLEIKAAASDLDRLVDGLTRAPWTATYVRELPREGDELRFGTSRNHGRIKWAVNKAAKQGVQVREAESENDVRAWYCLYVRTMRWHAIPPRPYRFFAALWRLLHPSGLTRLMLAERYEAGRPRLLAGSIFLRFGQTVVYAFNGRRQEDLSLRPNDLIQWHALHAACRDGFRWYDFGEVEAGQQGLAEFKSKWGASPTSVYRYHCPTDESAARTLAAAGAARRAAASVWQRLPLGVTVRLGGVLYRYL
jgi:CelD/BcsL family acetyltransferase involved in cellulose biosynthesis